MCMGESLFLEEEPHLLQENPPSLHVKIFISTSQLSPELALKEKKKKSLGMALLTFDLKKKICSPLLPWLFNSRFPTKT